MWWEGASPPGTIEGLIAPYPRSQANGVNKMFGLRPKEGEEWSTRRVGRDRSEGVVSQLRSSDLVSIFTGFPPVTRC